MILNGNNKIYVRVFIAVAILFWILLLFIDINISRGIINNINSGWISKTPNIIFNLFIGTLIIAFKLQVDQTERINFTSLLWRVFITGLITTLFSLLTRFFFDTTNQLDANPFLNNFFYHVNVGLISTFLISAFFVWKRLILYQKTKSLIRIWQVFEIALIMSIPLNMFGVTFTSTLFSAVFIVLILIGFILSMNLKWVAYLSFSQKWRSILFVILVSIYIYYFVNILFDFSGVLPIDLKNSVFIITLIAFILLYSIISLLVILFNLPTSSVFEQKLDETINFKRLSKTNSNTESEEDLYNILLESSVSSVMADAAWLETRDPKTNERRIFTYEIEKDLVQSIKININEKPINGIINIQKTEELHDTPFDVAIDLDIYKSLLLIPINIQNQAFGVLALLKDVSEGFNNEMIDIISTFTTQAATSIENTMLLKEAIANERYKEEIEIAQKVQRSLLPKSVEDEDSFLISAFSEAAHEVGGDYYDTFKLKDNKYAIIIGDVSGKGTSAAFNMAQLKGVFHSLVEQSFSPKEFMCEANNALSRCLEKTSFITASYFIIDCDKQEIEYARAGHCPTLFYNAKEKKTFYPKTKGLGLGIIRDGYFNDYIEANAIQYQSGDIMMIYTDGITEAKNTENEEFGYDRLQQFLESNVNKEPIAIQKGLYNEIYKFCGDHNPDDDYTTLIVKFK